VTTDIEIIVGLQLKQFRVLSVSREEAKLQCPRKDCKGIFKVNREMFRGLVRGGTHNPHIDTRPCPYCFRVSLRPKKVPTRKGRK